MAELSRDSHGVDLFGVPTAKIPVAGEAGVFPVHRIYCIGRNYADHVREMGQEPERAPPVYFLKPPDSVAVGDGPVRYPPRTEDLHHEVELVVAIGTGGSDIAAADVQQHVYGYAVGIDLTRRDLQAVAKAAGGPWDTAKSFEQAAPISPIRPASEIGHPVAGRIWLSVNDEIRQDANLANMIWPVDEAIADLSTFFTLAPGDLLFTGTPAGVGPLASGDRIQCGVDGVATLEVVLT